MHILCLHLTFLKLSLAYGKRHLRGTIKLPHKACLLLSTMPNECIVILSVLSMECIIFSIILRSVYETASYFIIPSGIIFTYSVCCLGYHRTFMFLCIIGGWRSSVWELYTHWACYHWILATCIARWVGARSLNTVPIMVHF